MDQFDSMGSLNTAPFIYSYFENNSRFERCYVDAAYLGASIDKVFLQYIIKTKSMRILYNNIDFISYQKKTWYNIKESYLFFFLKKTPLKMIWEKKVFFNSLIPGEFLGENVNTTANFMFTADFIFKKPKGFFYRTNRFITCTTFPNQAKVQNLTQRPLWVQLELTFESPVVI